MKKRNTQIFTIPNALSVFRILLIPVFVVLYLRDQYTGAAIVIALSGLTDLLDGKIARRFNQISELGKALDPVADKLTQAAMIICLMTRYAGLVYLFILFAVKELFMAIAGIVLLRKGKKLDGAMWFGKVSTAVFYVCMICLVAFPAMPLWLVNSMFVVTAAFLLLSFAMYLPQYRRMFREAKQGI